MNLARIPFLKRLLRLASISRAGARTGFVRLQRIEGLICLGFAAILLLIPSDIVRMLSGGTPTGLAVLDPGEMVRMLGLAMLAASALNFISSFRGITSRRVHWAGAIAHASGSMIRWAFLTRGPLPLELLGWADLFLAFVTVYCLMSTEGGWLESPRAEPSHEPWTTLESRLLIVGGIATAGLAVWSGQQVWYHLFRVEPIELIESDEKHFKYGPLGNEKARGLPLYVFEALPEVFKDKLPGGWQSLGLVFEENQPAPVGFNLRTIGFPSLTPNCALCHVGTYRTNSAGPQVVVAGAPSERLDFHGFMDFLFECGKDPRFTDGTLMAAIRKRRSPGIMEAAIYEQLLIPSLATGLRVGSTDFGWMAHQPKAGPGRQDAGAMLKFNMLRIPFDGQVSTSEIRDLWNQKQGYSHAHRWGGGGVDLHQENMLAGALFLFFQRDWFNAQSVRRMTNYFATLQPPPYPLPINASLAAEGRPIYQKECASCHDPKGARFGRIIPHDELDVDAHYVHASTPTFLTALESVNKPPFVFNRQQPSDGYLSDSLQGIWLKAPYLHNGSIPNLQTLLEPPEKRPSAFVRGGEVIDPVRVGFLTDSDSVVPAFRLDTRQRGNSNLGHPYGTTLGKDEKRALIEYLKTL